MQTLSDIVRIACAGCLLAGPAGAASRTDDHAAPAPAQGAAPEAVYRRNVACAAAVAALSARLPPTSSEKSKREASEGTLRERAFAVDAGKRMGVAEPEVDRLIAQKRDEITASAEKARDGGDVNRAIFIRTIECELDQLGDAIAKAKAEKASGEVRK